MSLELQRENVPKEIPVETQVRNKIVEEVEKRFDKTLIRWCLLKLRERKFGHNPQSDAKEVVGAVYKDLLTSTNSIDLTRSQSEIESFLDKALDIAISHFISNTIAQKRKPVGGFVSLDEIISKQDENDFPLELEQYFADSPSIEEKERRRIAEAISELESKDKRKADIVTQRYLQGKSDIEIAQMYGESWRNIRTQRNKALKILRDIFNRRN